MNQIIQKRLMALAGIIWFSYLILHMLINLNFLSGAESFNSFYTWFNESVILRSTIIFLLASSLIFHVYIAVIRQLDSNKKRTIAYQKSYPKVIPRFIAWSGAGILLSFIIFHFTQVQLIKDYNFYEEMSAIFQNPLMLVIYGFGFLALAAHLHHSLTNVMQTLGITHREYHLIVGFIILILIAGFLTIPISIHL